MASLFRRVTGRTCNQDDCTLQGQSVEPSQTWCEECGQPLFEMTAPNRPRQLVAALVATGVLAAGLGYGASLYTRSHQVRPKISLPQVVIPGADRSKGASEDAQRRLRVRLREIYRDGEAGAAEKKDLERLLAGDPGLARSYAEFEQVRLPNIIEACRHVRTGQALVAQKLYEHARADFLKATEEDPENANAWAALGGINVLTHREDEARQAYERALAIEPDSWIAHYNFGFYFARKGETEPALQHLDRAVELLGRPGSADRAAVLDDLRKNPVLDPLRQDPRFAKLLG